MIPRLAHSFPTPLRAFAVLAVLVAATVPGASAQQAGALAILEAAAARYRDAPALCADFVQTRSIPLLGESRTGRGRLCQKRPNFFSMRFSDPAGDLVVADGSHFWQYTPSTDPGQVVQARMETVGGSYDFHREFLENPAEKYDARLDGQEAVGGGQTHRLVLVPRRAQPFEQAVLWIDTRSNLVRKVELREENGSVTSITLSAIDLDATPPAELFRYVPSPGVQILRP